MFDVINVNIDLYEELVYNFIPKNLFCLTDLINERQGIILEDVDLDSICDAYDVNKTDCCVPHPPVNLSQDPSLGCAPTP